MNNLRILLVLMSIIPNAHAYIDPGSGSFMLQMLIASLIGASFTLKMYFKNIKDRFKNFFSSNKLSDSATNPDQKSSISISQEK